MAVRETAAYECWATAGYYAGLKRSRITMDALPTRLAYIEARAVLDRTSWPRPSTGVRGRRATGPARLGSSAVSVVLAARMRANVPA